MTQTITVETWNGNTETIELAKLEWRPHTKIHNSDETLEAIVESAVVVDPTISDRNPRGWRSSETGDPEDRPIGAWVVYRVVDLAGAVLWSSWDGPKFSACVRYTSVAEHVWGDRNVEGRLRRSGKLPAWKHRGSDGLGPRFF